MDGIPGAAGTGGSSSYETVRNNLIREISDSFVWLNIYRNSSLISGIAKTLFDIAELDSRYIDSLKEIHFLIYCDKTGICGAVERALKRLSFNTYREYKVDRSTIRGAINWPATYQRRIASGFMDKSIFVTSENYKDVDIVSNRLLKFLLHQILVSSEKILKRGAPTAANSWFNDVGSLRDRAKKLYRHPKLQGVSLNRSVKYGEISRVLGNRHGEYREIASCCKKYYDLFVDQSPEQARELIINQILIPLNTPTIYEFAVLFCVLAEFERRMSGSDSRRFTLIGNRERTVFEYLIGNKRFRIYYQTLPHQIECRQYSKTLREHGFQGNPLRPDIIVEAENTDTGETDFYIIEVKFSLKEEYTYIGVKDVLSYLYEYPQVDSHLNGAAILAVYPDTPESFRADDKIWVAGYSQLRTAIEQLIRKTG